MCREIHLSDCRIAQLDDCDNDDRYVELDDLLAESGDLNDVTFAHVVDHTERAKRLIAQGDQDAATIHQALAANMSRATSR